MVYQTNRKRGNDMTKINREEYEVLKGLDNKWKWIARDEDKSLWVFTDKPFRKRGGISQSCWDTETGRSYPLFELIGEIHLFQFIHWEDAKLYEIAELIEEYEHKEFYDYVGWKYAERREKEVKNIEWLKREIHKELEDWHGVEGGIDEYGINEIMLLINQLEESEVKRLERKIKELDSYNDELIRDNNQLRTELSDQYSHNLKIEIGYDEEVKSLQLELEKRNNKISELEYDLFVEKTRDSKNRFYWFTAKKTPLITDISYMSNENHFYGFKQVPNYHFIESHDLRFVTNCSLDDLVEQFR